jgi:SAM-dependent methyltransferase
MRFRARVGSRISQLGRVLDRRAPAIARLVRPIWRVLARTVLSLGYWEQRSHFAYYREVVELARRYVPVGYAALDVGARDTHTLLSLDWFSRRVALDLQPGPTLPGIERVVADFLVWEPAIPFDLVLCLQVLEHLDDPAAFIRKLLDTGHLLIVSVPYRWAKGPPPGHVQDPVDEEKLLGWAERRPLETKIVMDERERLIAVFRGNRPKMSAGARRDPALGGQR